MKRFICATAILMLALTSNAQSPWVTNLNSGSGLKLGTSASNPLNFYTNGRQVMSLGVNGKLYLDSLVGSGYDVVYVSADGSLGRMPNYVIPGKSCLTPALPWSQGGNNYPPNNTIGTCSSDDFILKSGDVKSIFLKSSGYVGVGIDNNNPLAALDISDNTASQVEHTRIYGDQMGTIETTDEMTLVFKPTTALTVMEGTVWKCIYGGATTMFNGGINANAYVHSPQLMSSSTSNTVEAFRVHNSTTNKTNFMTYTSGKTYIGSQTNAVNSASLNINMNSTGTGASADNAFDVYDQVANKVNFRVKASGFVYAREINVQLTTFPDYVFNDSYKLRSLESLEGYIQANKHLPNVPSANEIEKNGANLGELSRIQMEKIEELTLYVIALKKEVDGLKKQLNDK